MKSGKSTTRRTSDLTPPRNPSKVLRRKCACGNPATGGGQCESCALGNATVQRKSTGQGAAAEIPSVVDDVLRTPGQPLDAATRAFMEPRFGQDFSQVRVHSDARAAESAQAVAASAYAVGGELVFGSGQYAPHTAGGRKLLAHELAHVAQPESSAAGPVSQPGDASEREADHAADAVMAGNTAQVSTPGAAISRQPLPGSHDLPPLGGGAGLLDNASPFLAAAVASTTLDEFDTGKAVLKPGHMTELKRIAHSMQTLLDQYPLSTVTITGYADTVDKPEKNLDLGTARAAAVKQALVDLGIADAIISADSKGEGLPQAQPTKDETPSAKNRRVEVRFHPKKSGLPPLGPQLKLPTPGKTSPDEFDPPEQKAPDFTYHPDLTKPPDDAPRPPFRPKLPDYFKPIPPMPKGSEPTSVLDKIGKAVLDPVIDAAGKKLGLSESSRSKLKDGARSAVAAGAAKGIRAAAQAEGVSDPQALDAIENAVKAGIKQKGGESP
jgi:outer membrane protein OmpA-like peptidoglycan-associated protein